ncbi:MAG: hypothetical protein JXQ90_04175 [Cyclobacteriaceae bacterium]
MNKVIASILFLFSYNTYAQDLKILIPTGNTIDELHEFSIASDTAELVMNTDSILANSVLNEIIGLHTLLQRYLNQTEQKPLDPAYLALTENAGGYARRGFYLKQGDSTIKYADSYYVDIKRDVLTRQAKGLMSFPQLYAHELGHILYRLLSSNDSLEESSRSVNIHFFSLMTDFQIAFNEGFAEHMENIARLNEQNSQIIDAVNADTTRIAERSRKAIPAFRRDFLNPVRVGFYKMTMIIWYQQFEDYKRFLHPINGDVKYLNKSIDGWSNQDNLIYRNAGVEVDKMKIRNQVQAHATEGIVSGFFTQLYLAGVGNRYQDEQFYQHFANGDSSSFEPRSKFTPLENLFIKYFHVLSKYVVFEHSDQSQLIDFIEGYIQEFPAERDLVFDVYEQVVGAKYEPTLPDSPWMLVKDQSHGVLAMDAYAGLSVPVYTFNMNAARLEDLMMIDELSRDDALIILAYREKHGLFEGEEELLTIPGNSNSSKTLIEENLFDQTYFDNLEFPEELSMNAVITGPIKSLAKYTLGYYVLFGVICYVLIRGKTTSRQIVYSLLRYLMNWLLLVVIALFLVITLAPFYYFLLVFGIELILIVALFRKNWSLNLSMLSMMASVLMMSIY